MSTRETGPTKRHRFVLWVTRPPGRVYLSILALNLSVIAWGYSVPGGNFFLVVFGYEGLLAMAVIGFVRWAWALARRKAREPARRWALAPAAVVMTLLLCWYPQAPLRARWYASRGAMTRYARDIIGGRDGAAYPGSDRVGLYRAKDAVRTPWGMRFSVDCFLGCSGWAFSPSGAPKSTADELISYEHFSGPWFIFYEEFD